MLQNAVTESSRIMRSTRQKLEKSKENLETKHQKMQASIESNRNDFIQKINDMFDGFRDESDKIKEESLDMLTALIDNVNDNLSMIAEIGSSSDGKGTEMEALGLAERICNASVNILREERSIKVQSYILFGRIFSHTLRSVTMSGQYKHRRNPSACKIAEESACATGDSACKLIFLYL